MYMHAIAIQITVTDMQAFTIIMWIPNIWNPTLDML